ncbi:hypothetical protein HJG60_009855 [Phyllostomus discolor]|uniref:Uncharacterized protein n=1 Tax=Phyllostomus discolor TaxID=89673 RepID=A0A834EQ02_9CHIR|nr:hypothetical protein HJG60_009855 [Phyllostomus discolor]
MECFSTFLPSWKPHPRQVTVRVLCMAATCSQSCGAGKHVNMTPHQNHHLNSQHEADLKNSGSIHLSYILQSLIEIQSPLKGPQMNFIEAVTPCNDMECFMSYVQFSGMRARFPGWSMYQL